LILGTVFFALTSIAVAEIINRPSAMKKEPLWMVERTYSGDQIEFYSEKNNELVLLTGDPVDSLLAIKAYQDPVYSLIWTKPAEL